MKGLPTLIKLRQRELDKIRQEIREKEEILAHLIAEEKRLGDELVAEMEMATEQPEMAGFFGNFAKGIEVKQEAIRESGRLVNREIAALRDVLRDAFSDLKQLEIALEQQEKARELAETRKEQQELDEMGLQQYIQKKEGAANG